MYMALSTTKKTGKNTLKSYPKNEDLDLYL